MWQCLAIAGALLVGCTSEEGGSRPSSTTAGSTTGASATGASATGASATGASGGGGGGAAPSCDPFPTQPIGVEVGDILDPSAVVHGFLEGSAAESTLLLGDLRDCDGRAGVDAVLFIAARANCSTCREEAETLAAEAEVWAASGVRTVVLLLSGDLDAWRDTYGLEHVAVLADPQRTLDLPEPPPDPDSTFQRTVNGTPLYVVVDPRTGRIRERHLGADWDDTELLALAAHNADTR